MLAPLTVELSECFFTCYGFYKIYSNSWRNAHPLPTPATYPKGAGTPKKCFLFRLTKAAGGVVIFLVIYYSP